jgi:RNA polymerase sigma-70 factor (ECF subfamily)
MTLNLKSKKLSADTGWGVVYSLSTYKRDRGQGKVMIEDQSALVSLVERISLGDEVAMSEFYDATVSRVYGMAMKVVSRSELAEEVVGDVYLQVWRQANNYTLNRASPIGWLLMICRSRALDMLRREKSATRNQFQGEEVSDIEDLLTENPLDDIMDNEISKLLSAALKLLNKKQREAITLAFYKGMSHKEISDYTGVPLGTVKSNIRRAQALLKGILAKNELCTGEFYGKA